MKQDKRIEEIKKLLDDNIAEMSKLENEKSQLHRRVGEIEAKLKSNSAEFNSMIEELRAMEQ